VHSHRRGVLVIAVAVAAIAGGFGAGVAKHLGPYSAKDPATESVQAANRFEAATGRQIDPGVIALVASGNVRSPLARHRVDEVASELRAQGDVATVVTAYDTHNPAMVSRDGRSTYVLAYFKPLSDSRIKNDAERIEERFTGQHDVTLGGPAIANAQVQTQVSRDLTRSELLAFPVVFLLSLLFFRSLVAALLPPLLGGLVIVCTFFALRIVANFVVLSVFALNLTTGLGLGLGIDYSLFMVSRYREEAATTGFGVDALRRTLDAAGRTILFSALTIAAAAASLVLFPQDYLRSMGIAGAIGALVAATVAVVVLPALLAVLGARVNALAPKRLQLAADRDARPGDSGFWYRLSRFVMRRPAQIATVSAAFLIALGIPFTGVKFVTVNASVLPPSASARQVDDTLKRQFLPNLTSPLEVLLGAPAQSAQVYAFAVHVAHLPDVAAVAPALPAGPRMSLLQVAPLQRPLSDATQQLVRGVRALHEPFYVGVAGQTASFLDLESSLAAHLPVVLAVVVALTVTVLFAMTGSVVLPIKAILMNALNISAVFGILVLIFQDGNLQGLLGFRSPGALDATQPILLFAIGFGLATDYGVFLLSRIKEAYDAGVPNAEAVAIGLERTGRIVTAAALLFAVAIGALATSQIVLLKELGLGAAFSVLLDASITRALLVPSLMQLLGPLNWWAPPPLRRLHVQSGCAKVARPSLPVQSLPRRRGARPA
jgi:putative drug exporter of the RND superfamily